MRAGRLGSLRAPIGLVAVALAAGCAADLPEDDPIRPADALVWEDGTELDLGGVAIAVGSQEGPAEEILGWLAVESLVAAGAEVTADIALGDVQATREAQLAGLVDLYWENTGTGWLALLREIGPSAEPDQLYRDVRDEDLDENAIVWLPPAPADVGLGIVASPDVAEDFGVEGLTDLAEALAAVEEGIVVCIPGGDQPLGPGGLAALAGAAQIRIRPRLINTVPAGRLIELTEDGRFCPFALVDRLDDRLNDADVEFLDDDVGAFVTQNPAVTIRADTLETASGVEDLFAPVSERLDTETLRDLVARVTDDGEDPREVARDWLVDEGLARD